MEKSDNLQYLISIIDSSEHKEDYLNKIIEYTQNYIRIKGIEGKIIKDNMQLVMPCGDCLTKNSPCRTINCQYTHQKNRGYYE